MVHVEPMVTEWCLHQLVIDEVDHTGCALSLYKYLCCCPRHFSRFDPHTTGSVKPDDPESKIISLQHKRFVESLASCSTRVAPLFAKRVGRCVYGTGEMRTTNSHSSH